MSQPIRVTIFAQVSLRHGIRFPADEIDNRLNRYQMDYGTKRVSALTI